MILFLIKYLISDFISPGRCIVRAVDGETFNASLHGLKLGIGFSEHFHVERENQGLGTLWTHRVFHQKHFHSLKRKFSRIY